MQRYTLTIIRPGRDDEAETLEAPDRQAAIRQAAALASGALAWHLQRVDDPTGA